MLKVVIVEDETLIAKDLIKLLQQIQPDIEVMATLTGVKKAKEWFAQNPEPDLLFLDIQLSDGVSFDILEQVDLQCPVIFTTAYNEYAIRAFKVNSIDYLLKPVDKQDLEKALQKFNKFQGKSPNIQSQLVELIHDLSENKPEKKYKQRFLVQARNLLVPVQTEQIAYFLKDEIIFIHTYDGQRYVCDLHTMEEVMELLDPKVFYRANRQHIVHIDSVDNVRSTHKGLTIKLKKPLSIEMDISREKATEFKDWLS